MKITTSGKYRFVKRGQPKFMTEHRAVMMRVDPREDADNLAIHHIDGNKENNDPSNLMWMTASEHARLHHLGENHFPCGGEKNANYKHGMCVGGHSKEYKSIHNRKSYMSHREERLAKQNAYDAEHREQKRLYDKIRYWERKLEEAQTEERQAVCEAKLNELKESA